MKKLIIPFTAGYATSHVIIAAMQQANRRNGTVGGEILVPVLIILLIALGWEAKSIWENEKGQAQKEKAPINRR